MNSQKKPLPTTSYAVLGLLSFGEELSGYDIRQWARSMRFFYWNPAQSQIYSELRRLEASGYVDSRSVAQQGKPDKRLYKITDAGTAEFKRWFASDELDTTTILKHSVALKIFFGHMGTPDLLIELLEKFVENVNEQLGQLAVVQEYAEIDDRMTYPVLVADWGFHYLSAEVDFAESLIERIRQMGVDQDAAQ